MVHLDVDLKTRIEEFRSILAPKCGVKRHRQRLVFAGRLLQDGRALESYGVERNSTIHLLLGGTAVDEARGGIDISQMPPQLGALQRHVLQNPDILQQMLESPAMQSLLNDHDFLRSLLKMDPRLSKLLDNCHELNEMLHDPDTMKQASEALRNPVHVRDVLRSTDRSMSQLEELSGGSFDVLRQMVEDIKRPQQDEEYMKRMEQTNLSKQKLGNNGKLTAGTGKKLIDADDQLGTLPDDAEEGVEGFIANGDTKQAPEWLGTFDTNAMASMMQDQNMQHLLAQLIQAMPGPGMQVHPDDPFIDSGFIGQMFHAQTVTSMTRLQEAVEKLSLAADVVEKSSKKKKEKETVESNAPQDSPAALSGLHLKSPAANFKESFALFLSAEQESPENRYKGQLQAMQNMGFTNKEACIQALHNCDGNMNRAVEQLMNEQSGK